MMMMMMMMMNRIPPAGTLRSSFVSSLQAADVAPRPPLRPQLLQRRAQTEMPRFAEPLRGVASKRVGPGKVKVVTCCNDHCPFFEL